METSSDVAIELQTTEISVEGSFKKDEKANLTEVQAISVAPDAAFSAEADDSDKWEWVMVFEDVKPPEPSHDKDGNETSKFTKWKELNEKRLTLVEYLLSSGKEAGLIIARRKSFDDSKYYLLFSATEERFEYQAEKIEMTMKLVGAYGKGYRPFLCKKKDQFERANEKSFFRTSQRIELIRCVLEDHKEEGGLFCEIGKQLGKGIVTKFFPLHDKQARKVLLETWANPRAFFKWQPIGEIREYFGEYIALYFAYLGVYTESVAIAAALGIIVTLIWGIGIALNGFNTPVFAIWALTAYSIILAVWATVFIERWKREQSRWSYKWGMQDFEEREQERPQFVGELREGVYYKGAWIEWGDLFPKNPVQIVNEDADLNKSNAFATLAKITPPKERHYQYKWRIGKLSAGLPLLATMTVAVIIATVALLTFRLFLQTRNTDNPAATIVGAATNAISIIVLNEIWKKVAQVLTNWENHRTQTVYEDYLIFKIFIFEFINGYISLYYMAFFKNGTQLWSDASLADTCAYGNTDPLLQFTIGSACVYDLTVQLATILIVNIVIGQAQELLVPLLMSWGKYWWNTRKNPNWKQNKAVPRYELEANFSEYTGTIDDYTEMVIQYGYLTIFAAAFPLAPFLALVNNMVEVRTDAIKLLRATNRPPYRGAQDIGTWQTMLNIISFVAVITNCLLVGFSFAGISSSITTGDRVAIVLAIIVGMEHGLFLLKFIISWIIPDISGEIRKKMAQEEFLESETKRLIHVQEDASKGFIHNTKVDEQEWKFAKI